MKQEDILEDLLDDKDIEFSVYNPDEHSNDNFIEKNEIDYREKAILDFIDRYEKKYGECSYRVENIADKLGFGVYETRGFINKLIKEGKIYTKVRENKQDSSKFYRALHIGKPEKNDVSFLIIPKEILELKTTAHNRIILSKLYKLYRNSIINEQDKFKEFSLDSSMNKEYKTYDISLNQLRDVAESFEETKLFYFDRNKNKLIPTDLFRKMSYEKDFLKIPEQLMNNKEISDSKKFIFAYFMSYANDAKQCFSKYENIIDKLGVSRDVFYKTLREMKKHNLITAEDYIFKNGKIGRCIEADIVQIEHYYENSIIEKVDKIEVIEQATVEKVEQANIDSVDTIKEVNIYGIDAIPVETLIKELERRGIKHFINKESE